MVRVGTCVTAVLGWLVCSSPAWANHFTIDLRVEAGKAGKTAHAETAGIGARPKGRGVLDVQKGQRVRVKWVLRSAAAKEKAEDVVVHFFVVKEDRAGQRAVPKLTKDVTVETALTMDFKPKDKAQGELSFQIDKPGCYLLRLETIGAAKGRDGHEHFAALDLVVR